jgi:SAM-dependent methyltransferase
MKSYSSVNAGITHRLREAFYLYRRHRGERDEGAASVIEKSQQIERLVHRHTGTLPRGGDVLDLGCGQQLKHARYFARFDNHISAVDYNIIPGSNPLDYWRLFRANGAVRTAKTLARKGLGIDRRFDRALNRIVNRIASPISLYQMDAKQLRFDDDTFDFVYSISVFEHLDDPLQVAREVNRVLKPGGALYLGVHLYTSDTGCHDPRLLSGQRAGLPFWPHLRNAYADRVHSNAYLNRWRLGAYRTTFADVFPGSEIHCFKRGEHYLRPEMEALKHDGELTEFTEEELLVDEVAVIWRKPA